jgi:hypothetical protein
LIPHPSIIYKNDVEYLTGIFWKIKWTDMIKLETKKVRSSFFFIHLFYSCSFLTSSLATQIHYHIVKWTTICHSVSASWIRAVNESCSSEPDLTQIRLIKIRVELVKRFEPNSLAQTRLITIQASSWANTCTLTRFDIYI